MKVHLEPEFGETPLDEIDVGARAGSRKADRCGEERQAINNVLAVLSKALRHAATARVIDHAPSVGLLRV